VSSGLNTATVAGNSHNPALASRRNWTRDELILAFNLYCKTPFGRIHIRNPEITRLAAAIGRTPSAVSWKLANFARLDPSLKARKIRGASHGADAEIEIWKEFNGDWEALAFESENLMATLIAKGHKEMTEMSTLPLGTTRESLVRARVNQTFFRAAVLAAYNSRCCITGLALPQLLNASHIVPWAVDEKNRTNPRNGLCLNALHDRAFDCGVITVTTDYIVKVSPTVKRVGEDETVKLFLFEYEGKPIRLPERFRPDVGFLEYHNEHVFLRSS